MDHSEKNSYKWRGNIWKKCSTSLAIGEMPNKTTLRSHLFLDIIAIIKTTEHGEEIGPLFPTGRNAKWCNWYGIQYEYFSWIKTRATRRSSYATPGWIPKGFQFLPKRHLDTFVLLLYSRHSYEREPAHMSHHGEMDKLSTERVDGRVEVMEKTGGEEGGETEIRIKISENFQLIKN